MVKDMPEHEHVLFVYGSLMSGLVHQEQIEGGEFLGTGCTDEGFTLYDLGMYPAMVATNERSKVRGELYRVSAPLIQALDAFEEHPNVYRRQPVPVGGFQRVQAYIYAASLPKKAARIEEGDWRAHLRRRKNR